MQSITNASSQQNGINNQKKGLRYLGCVFAVVPLEGSRAHSHGHAARGPLSPWPLPAWGMLCGRGVGIARVPLRLQVPLPRGDVNGSELAQGRGRVRRVWAI